MFESPSQTLLKLLSDAAERKGMDNEAMSEATDISAERIESVLSGESPITVDEFVALALGLELGLGDMGGSVMGLSSVEVSEEGVASAGIMGLGESVAAVADRDGNQAAQIFQLGFALGCDIFFIVDTTRLEGAGFPEAVLGRFPEQLPIRLDAAYHKHMAPRYDPQGLTLALSFGSLYTCCIPWAAFIQVTLYPLPPQTPELTPDEPESSPEPGRGHLRLVE